MKTWRSISAILLIIIVIFPLLGMSSRAQQQETINTIFLLRHAEKADDGTSDPPLTEAGRKRSAALADLLEDAGITGIYSTDYKRTRQSVESLAERLGLVLNLYDPRRLSDTAGLLKTLPGRYVVSGHSNTTPELVQLLGGDPGTPIVEAGENDRLYILTRHSDGQVTTLLLRYGERFRP